MTDLDRVRKASELVDDMCESFEELVHVYWHDQPWQWDALKAQLAIAKRRADRELAHCEKVHQTTEHAERK